MHKIPIERPELDETPSGDKGGKGGGGASQGPVEAPNTLQSVSTARVIDVISEGEIVGLVDGAKSIYLDETPLQNDSGSYNFQGFSYEERVGLPTQSPIPGFPNVEAEVSVGVEVLNGSPITRTVTDPDLDALRVKIRIPALVVTDTASGDRNPTSVQVQISVTPNGGAEVVAVDDTISGKTLSPYEKPYRVTLPAGGAPWNVKVTRVTADSSTDTLTNQTYWASYTEIIDAKLTHPDTALLAITVDAEQFGSSIPQRAYEIKGIKLNVPSNYHPDGPIVTNLLLQSEDFATTWSQNRTTITTDQIADPNSDTTADLFQSNTTHVSGSEVFQSVTVTSALAYTCSVYVKAGTTDWVVLAYEDGSGNGAGRYFDVTNGTTGSAHSSGTGATLDNSGMTDAGSGWWRIWITTTTISTTFRAKIVVVDGDGSLSVTTGKNLYSWGAQLQSGANLFFYVKTESSTVTDTDTSQPRLYVGMWDGTFKIAWSDNPAWVLYDILSNNRYGLGDAIDVSQIDKWGLYTISQYCDVMIDDGFGGTEPRFTFNGVMNSRQEAYTVVNSIASTFRGMVYWGSGAVTMAQDAPADPVKLISPANVIGGDFTYSGAALKARHSAALVTWNDPEDGYKPAVAMVEDADSIQRFGLRQVEVAAYGATSKGQAHRFGRWILDSEKSETETVTYRAALDHADVRPGDIISVADPAYAGVRFGGRISSATTSQITLDDAVTLESSDIYALSVVLPDGTIEDRSVTNGAGATSVLNLATTLSGAPVIGAMWVLTASNLEPRRFRVVAVREVEKNIFEVTALLHDSNKFARVESNLVLETPDYSALPTGPILPPTDLVTEEFLYRAGPAAKSAVSLSWSAPTDPRIIRYQVAVKRPGQAAFDVESITPSLVHDFLDTADGNHEFRITALDGLGVTSASVTLAQNLLGLYGAPGDVADFAINIIGETAHLSWSPVTDLDMSHYQIRFTSLTFGADWGGGAVLVSRIAAGATAMTVPAMSGTYMIKAVDLSPNGGVESENAALIVSNVSDILALNIVESVVEEPSFAGAKSNVVRIDDTIQLDSADTMSDWLDLASVVSLTGAVTPTGTYEFGETVDLGNVYTSRLKAEIVVTADNFSNVLSGMATLAEAVPISGTNPSSWDLILEIRTTQDDPAGSPSWTGWAPFVISDYTARAFEWRAQLFSSNTSVTPIVSQLKVQVDMPDRVAADSDVACLAAGLSVVLTPAFKARPAIAISGQDMQTGDYITVTNQTALGFDVRFFNSVGTGVTRTMDWVAKGYGRVS